MRESLAKTRNVPLKVATFFLGNEIADDLDHLKNTHPSRCGFAPLYLIDTSRRRLISFD